MPQGSLPVQGLRGDAAQAAGSGSPARQDRVELSERARAMQVASGALQTLPDIQGDKVEDIKQLVKSGSYWIPGEKIAERMLGDGFLA
jgi:flagellar biosynthesis anti-sigma factor FlgM